MAFNKAKAEKQWRKWKEAEEEKLRQLGMNEESIQKLRQMDWEDFKEERRYREHLSPSQEKLNTGTQPETEYLLKEENTIIFAEKRYLYIDKCNADFGKIW